MGERYEAFLQSHKLEEYINHFGALGVAFERDLLDITEQQLEIMVERHGLKILDRRRFSKALASLRRRLCDHADPSRSDSHARSGSDNHHVRVKREHHGGAANHAAHASEYVRTEKHGVGYGDAPKAPPTADDGKARE